MTASLRWNGREIRNPLARFLAVLLGLSLGAVVLTVAAVLLAVSVIAATPLLAVAAAFTKPEGS